MKAFTCIFNPPIFVVLVCVRLFLTGCTNTTGIANPNGGATPTINPSTAQQEIKIGGSSSVYPALRAIATSYSQKNPNTKITFMDNTQTEGGIAGVKTQLLDIGGMSRDLKPEEAEGKVKYHRFASDALIVATHSSVTGVTNLTKKQLQDIYGGKVKNWRELGGPDAKIVVLDRPEDESAKKLLREHYLGKELKNSSETVVLRKEGDLIKAIESTPHSIGAFSRAYALANKLPVNVLALEGIRATPETIANQTYKMIRPVGIATSVSPSTHVQSLIDFATSQAGHETLRKAEYIPVN